MDSRTGYRVSGRLVGIAATLFLHVGGCQWHLNDADREVYRILDERRAEALGDPHETRVAPETVGLDVPGEAYAFLPHPMDPSVPESFSRPATQPAEIPDETAAPATRPTNETATSYPATTAPEPDTWPDATATTAPTTEPATTQGLAATLPATTQEYAATQPVKVNLVIPQTARADALIEPTEGARLLTLSEAIRQAFETGWEYQTEKETLYLAVLDLTLERFLWTPQIVGGLQAEFADYGQIRDFDRAMRAVSDVAVEQRLPYGGTVTAQLINVLARDLGNRITTGETGQAVVEADIPLLRGAGKVAQESRYQAEREVIYGIRAFERFRRSYMVRVASAYFDLLSTKQAVINAALAVRGNRAAAEFEVARAESGRGLVVDARQAIVELRNALVRVERAQAIYELARDRFNILTGQSAQTVIDVPAQEAIEAELNAALPLPGASLSEAIDTALRCRLDLVTVLDQIDDAKRGVVIARNGLLPDLSLRGSVTTVTDPNHLNSMSFNTERTTWRGSIDLEIPFQRVRERNEYRRSRILARQAQRAYDLGRDEVRRDVRDAVRQLKLSLFQLANERISVKISDERLEATIAQIRSPSRRGRALDIRDRLSAEDSLRGARDRLAAQQSEVWSRILELRLATGTLRLHDDGRWVESVAEIR